MAGETLFRPPQQVGRGEQSRLNIDAAALVKAGPGRLVRIAVLVAGAAGAAHDVAATGDAADGNRIAVIPATLGLVLDLDWPCGAGIVIVPGSGQKVSVSYV